MKMKLKYLKKKWLYIYSIYVYTHRYWNGIFKNIIKCHLLRMEIHFIYSRHLNSQLCFFNYT